MNKWTAVQLPLRRRALPRRSTIDLWLTDLTDLPLEAGPSGLTRKERVLKQRIQQQFVLRLLLGSYLGMPGKDVALMRSERGKPHLKPALAVTGLRFNVSHSGSWLAIVIARELNVGVDIEAERQLRRPAELARRYFSAAEADWLSSLEEPELSREFKLLWTAREALVKAAGSGLGESLAEISLDWQPVRALTLPAAWPEPADWSLLSPEMPAGVVGHVAAAATDLTLNRYLLQAGGKSGKR